MNKQPTVTLGIESSCDETGVALYHSQLGLLAHALHSQIAIHTQYGGVVPEIASRDHIHRLVPLTQQVLAEANLSLSDIDGIAYTSGPGLAGALLTGAGFARSLAYGLDIPALGVHHMEGHLLSPLLEKPDLAFPFLALLVSGGHTQLIRVDGIGRYRVLGDTLDDAIGEAFDKTAKLLEMGYPGGPAVSALALQGDASIYTLPRPMTDRAGLEFSFSGLKTAVLNTWNKAKQSRQDLERALAQEKLNRLVVAGGVSANRRIRQTLTEIMHKRKGEVLFPRLAFCTDNGAMIAFAGSHRLQVGQHNLNLDFSVTTRWTLEELAPVET